MQEVKDIYFNAETRRIRDLSLEISTLVRSEQNPLRLTGGMLKLLKELNKKPHKTDLSDINAYIRGMKTVWHDVGDQMDSIMRYSFIKAVVGARIKEQRMITVG